MHDTLRNELKKKWKMDAGLSALNALDASRFLTLMLGCCSSEQYANRMKERLPFENVDSLLSVSDEVWWSLSWSQKLEAISAHPRIGSPKLPSHEEDRFSKWSKKEQGGTLSCTDRDVLKQLEEANDKYFAKFGFIFLICATGKSAEDMLKSLEERIGNSQAEEIAVAQQEQRKNARVRLRALLMELSS